MRTDAKRPGRAVRATALALTAAAALGFGACRQDMQDQAKYEPLEASPFFDNGAASRLPVPGTVARGQLREDDRFYKGREANGDMVAELPLPLTRELLARGQNRYDAFCSPCHDRVGNGQGMIVRRGFKQPASFHEQRLKAAELGYFYIVISNGFGQMSSYADKLKPEDRWAVAAYVRALQLSQGAPRDRLAPDDLQRLQGGGDQAAAEGAAP